MTYAQLKHFHTLFYSSEKQIISLKIHWQLGQKLLFASGSSATCGRCQKCDTSSAPPSAWSSAPENKIIKVWQVTCLTIRNDHFKRFHTHIKLINVIISEK